MSELACLHVACIQTFTCGSFYPLQGRLPSEARLQQQYHDTFAAHLTIMLGPGAGRRGDLVLIVLFLIPRRGVERRGAARRSGTVGISLMVAFTYLGCSITIACNFGVWVADKSRLR